MKHNPPTRSLPEHPNLDQLKRQAKELLRADPAKFALHDAQLELAQSYGFDSWPKLKAYVEGATIKRLAELVRADDIAAVEEMIKARPELVNMEMSYGNEHRPLHFAVMNRSAGMTRLLMRHGANARRGIHPHRDATTALRFAVERGYDEIAAIIEEEEQRRRATASPPAPAPAPAPAKPTDAARSAVARGDIEWLRARHAEGKLTNPITWEAGGLLTAAVTHDHPEILELLLDFGFDPDERVRSGEGETASYSQAFPLWHCAALGRREMAELLIRRGASLDAHVDSSGTPVYSAYSHKQWEMVELLRRHGGVVGADTAALYRQTELVRQMIADEDRGALAAGVVSQGKTLAEDLLNFAASGGDPEIVRMALERIDWPRDDPKWFFYLARSLDFWNHIPWLYAANQELDRSTYIQCFRQVLKRCDPNLVGGFGRTVLHEAAAMGDHITGEEAAEFAAALLDAGARTDVRDELLKSTPLGWASRWGRAEVARAILERGADAVEADAEPWARPRAWAEKMGHSHVLAVLEQHGG